MARADQIEKNLHFLDEIERETRASLEEEERRQPSYNPHLFSDGFTGWKKTINLFRNNLRIIKEERKKQMRNLHSGGCLHSHEDATLS